MALAGEAGERLGQPPCFAGECGAMLEGVSQPQTTTLKKAEMQIIMDRR